jgi:hypothetical protein
MDNRRPRGSDKEKRSWEEDELAGITDRQKGIPK